MKVHYDYDQGFTDQGELAATHDIPDSEWAAYRKLVDAANSLEDRFVAGYAIEQVDEFADLRGLLSDSEIELLRQTRSATPNVPISPSVRRPAISVEQAAQEIIRRNAHKCQHRHQSGPFADGTVRCADCQGIIYGGTGVKKSVQDVDERDFHNPGKVDPRAYEGTV